MSEYLNEDQRLLADSLTRYLEREHPLPKSGISADDARHPDAPSAHWRAFADLGLLALTVDERLGGIHDDPVGVHAVMERFGRHRVSEPYLGAIVQCASILASAADDHPAVRALLTQVLEGRSQLALAHGEPQTDGNPHDIETRAERIGNEWALNGHKTYVAHAAQADRWLVLARTRGDARARDGLSLFLVDPGASGVRSRHYFNLDGSSGSEIWFDDARLPAGSLVGPAHQAWPLMERVFARAQAALCAEAVGAMSAVLDMTVAYARERKQFGSPIGSFQAIQHRLADMYMQLEKCRSLSQRASALAVSGQALAAVSAAKAMCCQSARFLCQSAIQLHGGLGMTDELALGQFVKRLMTISQTLGDEQHHLRQFARLTQPAYRE